MLFALLLAGAACTSAAPHAPSSLASQIAQPSASVGACLATEPPVTIAGLRVIAGRSELRAEDTATGELRWSLERTLLPGADTMRWRILAAQDGMSLWVQLIGDAAGSPSYLGTRRIDAQNGAQPASDIKDEIWWYDNVVLWTAVDSGGQLRMALLRPAAAGGGYRIRTLDPLTLAIRNDITRTTPPPAPCVTRR